MLTTIDPSGVPSLGLGRGLGLGTTVIYHENKYCKFGSKILFKLTVRTEGVDNSDGTVFTSDIASSSTCC